MKTFERMLVELLASFCAMLGISSVDLERHRREVNGEDPRREFKGSRRPEYSLWDEQTVTLYRSRYGCPMG